MEIEEYAIPLMVFAVVFGIAYIYCFYKAITVGMKRDLPVWLMVAFSLFASPFLAYGFATVTKKDSDKVPVKIQSPDREVIPMMLSEAIEAKIPVERIVELTDINLYCRSCGETFRGSEPVCLSCKKRRVWFTLYAKGNGSFSGMHADLNDWHKIPSGYRIRDVERRRLFV